MVSYHELQVRSRHSAAKKVLLPNLREPLKRLQLKLFEVQTTSVYENAFKIHYFPPNTCFDEQLAVDPEMVPALVPTVDPIMVPCLDQRVLSFFYRVYELIMLKLC